LEKRKKKENDEASAIQTEFKHHPLQPIPMLFDNARERLSDAACHNLVEKTHMRIMSTPRFKDAQQKKRCQPPFRNHDMF
jgi:hypothetical protein